MKIRCESCGKKFDPAEHDGICPNCGAWNSLPEDRAADEDRTERDPWEEPETDEDEGEEQQPPAYRPAEELSDDLNREQERLRRAAAQRMAAGMPAAVPAPAPPKRYGPLILLVLLTVALLVAIVIVPALAEARFDDKVFAYTAVEQPKITEAEGDRAVSSPFTYRVCGAKLVDYSGVWQMPQGSRLLRVELAVSMVGEEPEWDPQDPYLLLEDGSYRMAISSYDLESVVGDSDEAAGAFPYRVYWLETPGEEAVCSFYYLVPEETRSVTLCFERYSAGRYGERLEEITQMTIALDEEASGI